MSKNIDQLPLATDVQATDKFYLGRSPFGPTDDFAVQYSVIEESLARPKFRAYVSGSPAIPSSVSTRTPYNNITFDVGSYFDTATFLYTPQVAGYYLFTSTVGVQFESTDPDGTILSLSFNKNNSQASNTTTYFNSAAGTSVLTVTLSDIILMNGTTDYVSSLVTQLSGGNRIITFGPLGFTNTCNFFSGTFIF